MKMEMVAAIPVLTACCWTMMTMAGGPPSARCESDPAELPRPRLESSVSVEEALQARRSARRYGKGPLTLAEVSQLLWAAQGINDPRGLRTSPSAGALYPLELLVVAGSVEGLEAGVYAYRPRGHVLTRRQEGDARDALARAALRQSWMSEAPAIIVVAGVYERTTGKYGRRGARYVHMEAGHAAQNIYLQAEALDLATVVVGAFHDEAVQEAAALDPDEVPLYLMPVGKKAP